jgi:hypothetical protein
MSLTVVRFDPLVASLTENGVPSSLTPLVMGSGSAVTRYHAAHGTFNNFEIRVSTNLKVIERTTCCVAQCRAAADLIPLVMYIFFQV